VLTESQTNLEHQQAELEQTNEQLSAQAEVLDRKNEALHEAQASLQQRADELQRASRYKSEFLANMSHELRTPLNSSLILAKLLGENRSGNLNEEQLQFANTIYAAGNDLLNLINDILDLSKVEAGKLELNPQQIQIRTVAESLRAIFSPLAQDKHLAFDIEIAADAPKSLLTDGQRLEQVLKNLLSNAIKFTEKGRVTMVVRAAADGRIRFEVTDTGIGIAPQEQSLIFEAFHQGDGGTSRKYGGTGLGLSISRELAAMLGGTIELHSEVGQGSRFTLTLPAQLPAQSAPTRPAPAPMAPTAPATFTRPAAAPAPFTPIAPAPFTPSTVPDDRNENLEGARVLLVVEDDPSFGAILYGLAREMQYRCLVAGSVQEALSLITSHSPQAILLDVRLPDGSGLGVLQRLKEDPATRHIPVHIIAAEDFREIALPMGAVGFAIKPTTRDELVGILQKLERRGAQAVKRLLLVEDDDRQRESIVHLIGDDDIEIAAVDRGEAALELLRKETFDCMIIDLKLPDMDGHELLERMAGEARGSFPPVIVYTGRNLTREEEAQLNKYSRSIIIKGARSPERLLDEVTLFLHKVESQLSAERQTMLRTARNREHAFEGRKVLLVDDDMRNVFALSAALEQRGLTVEIGRNGVEAIDKLNQVDDIDLVLMDVMMPVMDGLEATRRIRADARFAKLPIIAITAKAMKDDQEQCRRAGANDYLAKPIDLDRLVSLLRVWIPSVERL
jgi:signal transduction histidine kinase/CheY-like chemotaxis protein